MTVSGTSVYYAPDETARTLDRGSVRWRLPSSSSVAGAVLRNFINLERERGFSEWTIRERLRQINVCSKTYLVYGVDVETGKIISVSSVKRDVWQRMTTRA